MRRWGKCVVLTMTVGVLSGCNAVDAGAGLNRWGERMVETLDVPMPTLVVPPATRVAFVDHQGRMRPSVLVMGTQRCPSEENPGWFQAIVGPEPSYVGENVCIVMAPTTTSVWVRVVPDTEGVRARPWMERWRMGYVGNPKDGRQTWTRPNGDVVVRATRKPGGA